MTKKAIPKKLLIYSRINKYCIDVILKNEKLTINDAAKDALYEISEGDCRRVENVLQSCAAISKDINESSNG